MLTKRGKPIDKGFLYKLLRNRLYLGEAVHKGTSYPGEHQAIIDQPLWDQVHAILKESPRQRAANTRAQVPALLKGLIFTDRGIAMTPTFTRKGLRLYRYYTSMDAIRNLEGYGEGVLTVDTVRRFKGLERPVIILWGFDHCDAEMHREIIYVGMSRATSVLYLVGSKAASSSLFQEN